jgi:arabinogalactan endo-1,4-beta-galactosidase
MNINKIKEQLRYIAAIGLIMLVGSCTQESPVTIPFPEPVEPPDRTLFAKGADISWVTKMEKEGLTFYNSHHMEMELMTLLKNETGVNAIRLRVWVNPEEGWNNIDDVFVKARRAHKMGLRLMIDFHFSDTWADPGAQVTPAAWADYDIAQLKDAVAAHVTDMLTRLKDNNIEPEWVQIGNETRNGMLYPLGHIDNGSNFADLINSGYSAVKKLFPEWLGLVHLDSGQRADLYTRMFNYLKSHNAKYDVIGMSLYPEPENWESVLSDCIANIESVIQTYNKPVMICEVGMSYDQDEACKDLLQRLIDYGDTNKRLLGLFYWEPQAPPGYNNGYNKGCFVNGTPTQALDPFKD